MRRLNIFLKSAGFNIPVTIFVILFLIVYYRKRKEQDTKTSEKPLFEFLLNTIIIPLAVELIALILCIWLPSKTSNATLITMYAFRVYFVVAFFWFFVFLAYQITVVYKQILASKESNAAKWFVAFSERLLTPPGKKERVFLYCVALIQATVAASLGKFNVEFIETGPVVVLTGRLPMILGVLFFTLSMLFYILVIFQRKKIKNLQVTPFFVIIGFYCAAVGVQLFLGWHTNNIVSFFGFLMTIIYFTIESQDIEILNAYNTTKENEKKEIASKQKILVNMSHEVRSPMHNILGYGDIIISEENMPEEEFKTNMSNITNSIYDLRDMIDNMHDISNIESEQIKANQNQYESKLLYERINDFALRKSDKDGLRFTFELDQMLPNVLYGDSDKIYKIITKILENSIDKTNYGEVKLNITGQMLDSEFMEFTYTVSNTGHVMTNEMFDMSYEDFMRSTENIDYIKLGVIIAKKYVEILGGEIEFINEKGQGTRYIIKLRQKVLGTAPVGSLVQN